MSRYDGTITTADPRLVETFRHVDGSTSYVLVDDDAYSPAEDYETFATLYVTDSGYRMPAGGDEGVRDSIREAIDHYGNAWGNDDDMIPRYLRAFCDVAAVDTFQANGRDATTYIAAITWQDARRAMGENATREDAARVLAQECEDYRAWSEGETYGVIMTDARGDETESLWGMRGYETFALMVGEVNDAPIGDPDGRHARCEHCGSLLTLYGDATGRDWRDAHNVWSCHGGAPHAPILPAFHCRQCGYETTTPDAVDGDCPNVDAVDNDGTSHDWTDGPAHTGHYSRLGGTYWCDTCNSPYCDEA